MSNSCNSTQTAEAVNVESLATALALIGKASVVSCFCIIFIYSSEVFPTVIRTVGVGVCAFFGRVGSLLAPQILLLVSTLNSCYINEMLLYQDI